MRNHQYPRLFINIVKTLAYRIYKLAQLATAPPLDKYDFETFDLIKKLLKPNANCIDVGAHNADILKKLIKVAPYGNHFAFEPIPALYKMLKRKYSKKVQVYDIALSDKKGIETFFVVQDRPAISSLRKRNFKNETYRSEPISVKVDTLDNIIPENIPIDLIKIDVEGAELKVLKGAVNLLKRSRPFIVFEFGLGGSDLYDSFPEEMYDLLQNCGLSVSTLEYYLQGKGSLSRSEFIGQYEKNYNYFFIAYPPDFHLSSLNNK